MKRDTMVLIVGIFIVTASALYGHLLIGGIQGIFFAPVGFVIGWGIGTIIVDTKHESEGN